MNTLAVIGLGNPGKEYEKTRHNTGFLALDAYAEQHQFPAFEQDNSALSHITKKGSDGAQVILVKPLTFMNQSGRAAKKLQEGYPEADFLLVHDDLDIPFGEVRFVRNRGSAGHKGVESVMQALDTKDFSRIRIGILPEWGKPENPEHFVLERFSKEEAGLLEGILADAGNLIDFQETSLLERNGRL